MSGPCYQDLVEKWRESADELERELANLRKILPPDRRRFLTQREKEIIVQYVQGNAVISTIRTCANELDTENSK